MNTTATTTTTRRSIRRRAAVLAVVATAGAATLGTTLHAGWMPGTSGNVTTIMERVAPGVDSPSGNNVLDDCQSPEVMDPLGWADATARLRIRDRDGASSVVINVRDARPNTYFTVWLRLGGNDSNGNPFGGNPVTGGQATPLAPTSDLPAMLAATGMGNGTDTLSNGFRTDRFGKANFGVALDFPIVAGAYPFQRFPNWDATDPRLPADEPAIHPVAIAGPQGIYTLRVVSHCVDDVGHGLTSGQRELWWDWTAPN